MIGWILLGTLTLMLLYLLLASFAVRIDGDKGALRVKLFHLGSGRVCYRAESIWLDVKLLGMRFSWDALALAAKAAAKQERKQLSKATKAKTTEKVTDGNPEAHRQRTKSAPSDTFRRMWAVLRSFKIKECRVLIDLGSPERNGLFYPLAWWAGRWSGQSIGITFQGEEVFVLEVQNSLGRMLWAFLRKR